MACSQAAILTMDSLRKVIVVNAHPLRLAVKETVDHLLFKCIMAKYGDD